MPVSTALLSPTPLPTVVSSPRLLPDKACSSLQQLFNGRARHPSRPNLLMRYIIALISQGSQRGLVQITCQTDDRSASAIYVKTKIIGQPHFLIPRESPAPSSMYFLQFFSSMINPLYLHTLSLSSFSPLSLFSLFLLLPQGKMFLVSHFICATSCGRYLFCMNGIPIGGFVFEFQQRSNVKYSCCHYF